MISVGGVKAGEGEDDAMSEYLCLMNTEKVELPLMNTEILSQPTPCDRI